MLYFDPVTCYLNRDNKGADIRCSMNYMKVLELSNDDLSP